MCAILFLALSAMTGYHFDEMITTKICVFLKEYRTLTRCHV